MAILACVVAFVSSEVAQRNARYYVGANTDRTFEAAVVGVMLTQHGGFECSGGVRQYTESVVRITFDRDIQIWSENGTGEGFYFPTRSVDLPLGLPTDPQRLAIFLGKEKRTFHYRYSFLSVCDESRIPTIRYFGAE
jgi:hypothetical protein